jgi:hypothetical protein
MPRALALFCVFLFAAPQVASAEWHFTPLVGLTFKGKTSGVSDWENATTNVHKQFGGAVTAISAGTVGFEGLFLDTPKFFKGKGGAVDLVDESGSIALMGNVVVTAPRRWTEYTLRPFFSGGFGLMRVVDVDKARVAPTRENLAGFNIGGGAIGFFTRRTGVRFDLRYFRTLRPVEEKPISINSVRVRYMTLSVGVVFRR